MKRYKNKKFRRMIMKKRVLCLLLGMLMAVSIFAGCSNTASTATGDESKPTTSESSTSDKSSSETSSTELKPATLRVWAHWGSEQRRPTIKKMIDGFNKKYEAQGIKAEYVYVPFAELETKLIASVASGNPANAVVSAIEDVGVKAMRKQATNIKEYLDPGTKDLFYARYWDTVVYNDGVYGLPFNSDTRMIFYNKTMFEEAGVKVEDITSWDAMFAAADKLDAKFKNVGNYKAAFLPVIGNFGFDTIAMGNGGGIFDNAINPQTVILDSKNNVEALEYAQKWSQRYGQPLVQSLVAGAGSGAQDLFISGQVAMFGQVCNYIAGLGKYGVDESGKKLIEYGVFAHPQGPSAGDNKTMSAGGGFVTIVPFGASNPRESTKFVEYMCGNEASTIWAVEQKDVMCNIKANEEPSLASATGWDLTIKLMENTQVSRRNPYATTAGPIKDSAVDALCRNFDTKSAQEVLKEASEAIKAKIAEEKAIWGE
jgi:multiple sugar transport system substrate-binding protein